MLPRPSLYAFSADFVHFEAHLGCALLGFSKKRQTVLRNCLEETDKFDLGKNAIADPARLGRTTRKLSI